MHQSDTELPAGTELAEVDDKLYPWCSFCSWNGQPVRDVHRGLGVSACKAHARGTEHALNAAEVPS